MSGCVFSFKRAVRAGELYLQSMSGSAEKDLGICLSLERENV